LETKGHERCQARDRGINWVLAALALALAALVAIVLGAGDAASQSSIEFVLESPSPQSYDNFGASLAIADIDADGFDDIAAGVPYEGVGGRVAEHA